MISLAPHLQRALEAMSKDMGVDQQALVNQAVFAWLRINGYTAPGVAVAAVAPQVVAPVEPGPVEPGPAEPVASVPTPLPFIAPVGASPVELGPARVRMAEIDADLEKLTKPWAAWAPVQAEDHEDEDDEDAAEPEPDKEEQPEPALPPLEEEKNEEDAGLDGNTGENDAGDSTVVLRSVPIALYLQRDGEAPVKVTTDRFVIGRGPHCDLVIDSPRISREHVAITRRGVVFYLEDLNSSNGTWLGEERLSRRELESGDVISLGNQPLTFMIRGQ